MTPSVNSTPLSETQTVSRGKGQIQHPTHTCETATAQGRCQAPRAPRVAAALFLLTVRGEEKGCQHTVGPGATEMKDAHIYYLRCRLGSITTLLGVAPLLVRLGRLLGIVATLPTVVLTVASRGRGTCSVMQRQTAREEEKVPWGG